MDMDNYGILTSNCPEEYRERLYLLMDFAPGISYQEVPDPYYGGESGFDLVLDMVEAGSRGLLDQIIDKHQL